MQDACWVKQAKIFLYQIRLMKSTGKTHILLIFSNHLLAETSGTHVLLYASKNKPK